MTNRDELRENIAASPRAAHAQGGPAPRGAPPARRPTCTATAAATSARPPPRASRSPPCSATPLLRGLRQAQEARALYQALPPRPALSPRPTSPPPRPPAPTACRSSTCSSRPTAGSRIADTRVTRTRPDESMARPSRSNQSSVVIPPRPRRSAVGSGASGPGMA